MARSRTLSVFALCFLALFGSAYCQEYFSIEGKVYCDTCHLRFETRVSEPIPNAKVKVECKDATFDVVTYVAEGVTDSEGKYRINVEGNHDDQICEVVAVSSSMKDCSEIEPGKNRAETHLNMAADGYYGTTHTANPLAFTTKVPLPICSTVQKELGLVR